MLSDRRIGELTVLFKKHVQATAEQKIVIERQMKRYGCKNSIEAFKKIREHRRDQINNYKDN
ncbi:MULTISPECIES: hypothetical protein [Clostridium]|uniref:hypothetical protein n=1 Tax=Clostridium TaxID=1485 RepID=UPI0008267621|nr:MULTISPECIES: hypothetical protein [Clostridium]PJI06598.1 hypothetical protein CUB90_01390 [Clostridium sp. CT7]